MPQADQICRSFGPNKILVKTSPTGAAQANALEDLTQQKIDALVVLPFNSDELTGPVGQVKKQGTFITVVDRGLKEATIQEYYYPDSPFWYLEPR